jgi:hypothetical protein
VSMFYKPACPQCKVKTLRARIPAGPTSFGIRTFECPDCDKIIYQLVVDLVDPMKSHETKGWLRGELRAPT